MKNKLLKIIPSVAILATGSVSLPLVSSCSNSKNVYDLLCKIPRVVKVDKLEDLPNFASRYMVWFKHPLDWKDESKGYFNQRVEVNFRGFDRVNQFFTCGYEKRDFQAHRTYDFEIGNRYLGNIIKPEFRFFDQSIPEGLSYQKTDLWNYLTNENAMEDFHSMITGLKTVLSGKWCFCGTSKGGETTNMFAMIHPDDCDVYVPYVAPKLYKRNEVGFTDNIYSTIGDEVLGKTICDEYRNEISKFQYYLLTNRKTAIDSADDTPITRIWKAGEGHTFTKYASEHPEYIFDLCVSDFACGFWQYDQDIVSLRKVNDMADGKEKLIAAVNLQLSIGGPDGYCMDSLFFPYFYQACTEMGEQLVDFSQMIKSLAKYSGKTEEDISKMIAVPTADRPHFYWKVLFNEQQYKAWYNDDTVAQNMTMANKLEQWWTTDCKVPVINIYGGADTWYYLKYDQATKAKSIKSYVGKDTKNAWGRTHKTRISSLPSSVQNEIWAQLDEILNK